MGSSSNHYSGEPLKTAQMLGARCSCAFYFQGLASPPPQAKPDGASPSGRFAFYREQNAGILRVCQGVDTSGNTQGKHQAFACARSEPEGFRGV